MSDFVKEYTELLIKQYFTKPKARGEIEATVSMFENAYSVIRDFPDEFDVDTATGDRLDKIGKIVGVPRNVPFVVGKIGFGFSDNPDKARGFYDLFAPLTVSAPMIDLFSPPYTDQQLEDFDYRFLIKAKISVNNASAFMVSDDRITIQDVIQQAFNGNAYVIDRRNMSFSLYITPAIELDRLRLLFVLKLLPKPQGVSYDEIVQAKPSETFGFSDNANSLGFGDLFNPAASVGFFANKVVL